MVRSTKPARQEARPLGAQDWIKAAQAVLAAEGVDAVRVEPLAKQLKVTKGSFYWHFKDRGALLEAMLADWRRRAVSSVIRRVERAQDTPAERLKQLIRYPLSDVNSTYGVSIELAIRLWAKRDANAAAAVEEVDEHRITYIASLVRGSGAQQDRAAAQAFLIYAFMLAKVFVLGQDIVGAAEACEQMLLSLALPAIEASASPTRRARTAKG